MKNTSMLGAGIRNAGDLKLINVHVRENTTKQANGGEGESTTTARC